VEGHRPVGLAETAADLDAVHLGHHPVEDRHAGGIVHLEGGEGVPTVLGHDHVVSPLAQRDLEDATRSPVVFGDENLQGTLPPRP
jgi:hypothetical protein